MIGDFHAYIDCCSYIGAPDRNIPTEDQMIEVYRKEAHCLNVVFSETAFNYAKAVSCLRLITIVRVSDKTEPCLHSVCYALLLYLCRLLGKIIGEDMNAGTTEM